MAMVKCPRCELNYMNDGDKVCNVCRREMSGEPEKEDIADICPECGENPVVKGYDVCLLCLQERRLQDGLELHANQLADAEDDLSGMQVSAIDEIDLGISDDIPPKEMQEIDRELGIDEEEEEEEIVEPQDDAVIVPEELDAVLLDDEIDDLEEDV